MAKRFWLVKSDPETFGWKDLLASPARTTRWDGVRNHQARNSIRDEMKPGDGVLFYHSQSDKSVIGTAVVVKAAYPDPSQFDSRSKGYDPGSKREEPRWFAVDLRADRAFPTPVNLDAMRREPVLRDLELLRRGSRLSVMPVTAAEWRAILRMGGAA